MTRILKKYVREVLDEVKIGASPAYMKKETVRQDLEDLIKSKVASGDITDQTQLDEWFATALMSLNALKMVPIAAYSVKKKARRP